jgi:Fe2+ transport system protein FeoA
MTLLQNIPLGIQYRIVSVQGTGFTAQRVRELGLIPGAVCTMIRRAPFGGPMEIALERRKVGLRLEAGLSIVVEPHGVPLANTVERAEIETMPEILALDSVSGTIATEEASGEPLAA